MVRIFSLMLVLLYEACSKSIRFGIVVVVHWVRCVCNQSWHVRTCLRNSWHKLQVTASAQLAVVFRGSNTCVYVIATFTMCESTEQRICIKFCFKIGKTATETYQLLQQVYGEDAMGRTQVFDWFRRSKEGRSSVQSDPRSGRPSTPRKEEMIAKVRTVVRNNRRLTVREIADDSATFAWISSPKTTGKMTGWDWILHHDNAPAHTSHLVQQFLAKHGTAQLQQPLYSPDLAPCDFFIVPRLKKVLKGHRFEATEDIKRNSTNTLLDIPKEEFAKCFQQWQQRWAKRVAAEGNYVEDS